MILTLLFDNQDKFGMNELSGWINYLPIATWFYVNRNIYKTVSANKMLDSPLLFVLYC